DVLGDLALRAGHLFDVARGLVAGVELLRHAVGEITQRAAQVAGGLRNLVAVDAAFASYFQHVVGVDQVFVQTGYGGSGVFGRLGPAAVEHASHRATDRLHRLSGAAIAARAEHEEA